MRRRRVRLLIALLATSAACAPRQEGEVVFDLGAALPLADVRAEVRAIDLGWYENRWHLARGWIGDSWFQREGAVFVAAASQQATLRFRMAEAADVTLRLFGRPFGEWPAEESSFEVLVNGEAVGRRKVVGSLHWYDFPVAASRLVTGTNELTIDWPAIRGGGLPPNLGWFRLEVVRRVERQLPSVRYRADEDSLLLPAAVRLDYHVRLPAAAVLEVARVSDASGSGGALAIDLERDGHDKVNLARLKAGRKRARVDLGDYAGEVVRLSLEAVQWSEGARYSGLVVESAVVRAPVARPPDASGGEQVVASTAARRPNVIFYVVDTLRRDHLGLYGYPRPVSPELDRFADQATIFDHAVGQSSWTRASMASIFTGLWPLSHATNGRRDILAPEALTLGEILQEHGYRTMAIVENHNVFAVFGFSQGIDDFTQMGRGNSQTVTETFLGWLDRRDEQSPFFAWLHSVDPHDPYVPPPGFRDQFDDLDGQMSDLRRPPQPPVSEQWTDDEMRLAVHHLVNLYDGEIAANDHAFGELLQGLAERGQLDGTMIVFVSDHGEEFQEHGGWTHGHNLNVETLDVPLVIRFPDRGHGQRIPEVVQQIDLMPTVLDYLGITVPEHVEGSSLLPLLEAPVDGQRLGLATHRPAFSYVALEGKPHRSVVDGDWKLIQRMESDRAVLSRLYFHPDDPSEMTNLVLDFPIRARFLERMIEARMSEENLLTTSEAELDEETERALRALGYLQ